MLVQTLCSALWWKAKS